VDRKFGNVISYIRAIHLVELCWSGQLDRVTITQRFSEPINTVELAQATFRYIRGRRYVFYIEWLKRERGQIFAGLSGWGIEEIEDEMADAAPLGAALPF
jgi:TnpA family transposase